MKGARPARIASPLYDEISAAYLSFESKANWRLEEHVNMDNVCLFFA